MCVYYTDSRPIGLLQELTAMKLSINEFIIKRRPYYEHMVAIDRLPRFNHPLAAFHFTIKRSVIYHVHQCERCESLCNHWE